MYTREYGLDTDQEAENYFPSALYRRQEKIKAPSRLKGNMDDFLAFEIKDIWGLTLTEYLALTKDEMILLCYRAKEYQKKKDEKGINDEKQLEKLLK